MNITIPGDHSGVSYTGIDTVSVAPSGPAVAPPAGGISTPAGGISTDDRISVSTSTAKIQDDLSGISASQSSRISKLAALYAGGRYEISSSKIAQSIVSGAIGQGR